MPRPGRPPVLAAATIGVAVLAAAAYAQTPKTFSVPFEESQTTLSKEGQTVVGAAVEMAQECSEASVLLVGHDDSAKADEISQARAQAVHKAMVDAGGVGGGPGAFKITAQGAKQLKAPAPNRQNRRVDISVSCK
jgi:outer membrane protein OmpA-like peptidoglycan-associated protein